MNRVDARDGRSLRTGSPFPPALETSSSRSLNCHSHLESANQFLALDKGECKATLWRARRVSPRSLAAGFRATTRPVSRQRYPVPVGVVPNH